MCKVDLHVHTSHSGDNDAEPEAVLLAAIDRGLDAVAFTEHYYYGASSYAERLAERYKGVITVLRGVEFSAREGHCLVFGVDTDRLGLKYPSISELAYAVGRAGGVVIPSHPYRRGSGIGDLVYSTPGIIALEGCNGCNLHAMNTAAIEAANAMGIPYTGGSDAHFPSDVGGCYTVFESPVTQENLVAQLRAGKFTGRDERKISKAMASASWLNY